MCIPVGAAGYKGDAGYKAAMKVPDIALAFVVPPLAVALR